MSYTPHTTEEIQEMMSVIGISHIDELFSEIPSHLAPKSFEVPPQQSELETLSYFHQLAKKNASDRK